MRVTEQVFNQVKQVKRLGGNDGLTIKKIADLFGCSPATIYRIDGAVDWKAYCQLKKEWAERQQKDKAVLIGEGHEPVEELGDQPDLASPEAVHQLGRIATALEEFVKLVK